MKKNGIYVAMIALGLSCGFTACSDEDDPVVVDPVHGMDDYALKGLVNEDAFSRQLCDEISTQLKATGRYEVVETHQRFC